MDHRDRPIWIEQAKRKYARDQLKAIDAISTPWAKEGDRLEMIRDLKRKAAGEDTAKHREREQRANWRDLRRMTGGKG